MLHPRQAPKKPANAPKATTANLAAEETADGQIASLQAAANSSSVVSSMASLQRQAISPGSVVQREFTSGASKTSHFNDHGSEFGATDEDDYEQQSESHYANRANYQSKSSGGKTYVFDSASATLGIYTGGGKTISFFKPKGGDSAKAQAYYDRQ